MLGFFTLHFIAWLASERHRAVAWRTVLPGMALTIVIAALALKLPPVARLLGEVNGAARALEQATAQGTSFVFGYLGGGPLPFEERQPGASFVLAFRAMPLVIVISALSSLLFYWKVLPVIVKAMSWVLERALAIGGAVGLAAAATVFVGMVEAPLVIRPYLVRMSRSELFMMMTCGMATIAGTVMFLYATILSPVIPGALGHIFVASIISMPAAIVVAVLMVPPVGVPTGAASLPPSEARSTMDAITRGTTDGAALLINILAMLIVLVALVALANEVISLLPQVAGAPLTLQRMLGWAMAPVVWLTGIPWVEAPAAGALMGTKTVLNEFIAYLDLAHLDPAVLSARSRLIMLYALCGFANFGSLGILIGGISTMAPERRADIVSLGAKALVSGTIATLITGSVVGMLA